MEQTFEIPARPWGEAEVKFLAENVHRLDEETRAELGPLVTEVVQNFVADVDAPVDANGETLTPEEIAAGLAAFNTLPDEAQEAARAEAEAALAAGEVVNNDSTDNA